jgi:hypothetical protein
MHGALPQNHFQTASHPPESIEKSVILSLCAAQHRTTRIRPLWLTLRDPSASTWVFSAPLRPDLSIEIVELLPLLDRSDVPKPFRN